MVGLEERVELLNLEGSTLLMHDHTKTYYQRPNIIVTFQSKSYMQTFHHIRVTVNFIYIFVF